MYWRQNASAAAAAASMMMMVSSRFFFVLFSLALATVATRCDATLRDVTEEHLWNLRKRREHIRAKGFPRAARTASNTTHNNNDDDDETLPPTAVKRLGDGCYSGTSCDYGQFCGLTSSGYSGYGSFSCKFCDSYNPAISSDVAEDREYNICGSADKRMFYGRCLEGMEEKADDVWFDYPDGDDYGSGDYYDYHSGLGFDVDTLCWAKDSKECCKPAVGAIAGVVVSAAVLITAVIIIIAFCCKCCCFKNKQEAPAASV